MGGDEAGGISRSNKVSSYRKTPFFYSRMWFVFVKKFSTTECSDSGIYDDRVAAGPRR